MEETNIVTQVFLPLSLAFIMFSVGLELTLDDFKRVVVRPRDFFVGAVSQVIVLPLVAFALLSVWTIEPALAVGVMIIASCPGGVTSNLMTYLARGDTALSVSLTAVISLLAVVTLPLIVSFSIQHFMNAATAPELPIGKTIIGVFLITTVPVCIGMLIKHFAAAFAKKFERIARLVASVLFIVIVLGAIASERENIVDYFIQAGTLTLTLNVVMMVLAALLAHIAGMGVKQRIAITLECGLQNGTLAIFVAATLIGNKTMTVPGGIYSLLMFATAILYLIIAKRQQAQD
ncbi:bile acid:sodium symporter family protein [Sneathiella marina]|uniref:Bile acid:sodium symporter family protein n=1 Tax=Sneathiella marina TaxID=2950108 RepID=A0ABY4W7J0_9PROT|nr:bile acid:sodium symporter family protein [Sneathiella marina]USG61234.1 bile acid:sodium symporter family protein [Sneathiella marina]